MERTIINVWIDHAPIANGSVLELIMGKIPNKKWE